MRLPTYDEIAGDENQREVYETPPDESLFVVGPPGSGKTVLAVRRAEMLAAGGQAASLITYNRMLRRLIVQLTEDQIRAQTMHQFVNRHYQAQMQKMPPEIEPYVYDWDSMFAMSQHRQVAPEPTPVIVDEGQDLSKGFFGYLRRFVSTTMVVFADADQALSRKHSTLRDIKEAAGLGDPVLLCGNHRNTPEVARVAEHYHAGEIPAPEVHRPSSGELPQVLACREEEATSQIENWFRTRSGHIGVAVVRNSTGKRLHSLLHAKLTGERVDFYTHNRKNDDEIDLLSRGITILNVKSIKGQEFDTVFVMELDRVLEPFDEVNRRKMYMLCARARDHLFLVHDGDSLPKALVERLPGPDILQRS